MVALRSLVSGRRGCAGLALLALFGATKVLQAFFPIDQHGITTTTGTVHNVLGNVALFVLPFAVALLGGLVARATGRHVGSVLAFVVIGTAVGVLAADAAGVVGLAQRIYLVSASLWMAATAWTLLRPKAERVT